MMLGTMEKNESHNQSFCKYDLSRVLFRVPNKFAQFDWLLPSALWLVVVCHESCTRAQFWLVGQLGRSRKNVTSGFVLVYGFTLNFLCSTCGRVHLFIQNLENFLNFFFNRIKKNTMSGPLPLNVMARRVLGIARASIAAEMEQRRAFEAAEAEGNQVVSFFKNRGYVLK